MIAPDPDPDPDPDPADAPPAEPPPGAARQLVVLGTASQVPTATRNHNAYLLRFDDQLVLVDPGEGTQRQMTLAHQSVPALTAVLVTHFHGDHCLGLPGVVQRRSLEPSPTPLDVFHPAAGSHHLDHLLAATATDVVPAIRRRPVIGDGPAGRIGPFALHALTLDHPVPTVGWRLEQPPQRHFLPDRLAALGVSGPDVGRLERVGRLTTGGRTVDVDEVSVTGPGARVAFVLDTRLCDAAFALAADVDLLVCEATYRSAEADLAHEHGHLTAAQAARIAAESGARRLVLTHFSSRYPTLDGHLDEAREVFDDVVAAHDLQRIALPRHL